MDYEVAVVGLVRNAERSLRKDIARIQAATRMFRKVHFLLVESDSSDQTVVLLNRLTSEIQGFRFLTLGRLASTHPKRTERIAKCRNAYLDELRSNSVFENVEYVLVVDLDNINNLISGEAIKSAWELSVPWDVCTANQADYYYDIWALRHPDWCPSDCFAQVRRLAPLIGWEPAVELLVHSRMIHLDKGKAAIEVESAFGGFAIYKKVAILSGDYVGLDANGEEICEHVPFHAQLRANGHRIFINPAMVTAKRTDHAMRKTFVNKLLARVRLEVVSLLKKLMAKKTPVTMDKSISTTNKEQA